MPQATGLLYYCSMTSRERVLAQLQGRDVDHLSLMPITMMFAADQIGVPYGKYVTDHRLMAEAQMSTAEKFEFDYVSVISDPAREAADLGAAIEWFEDQPPAIIEHQALLAERKTLTSLKFPDPLGGGRMHDRVQGVAVLKERIGQDKIVEGWVEGPCAMSADLRGINTLMLDFFDDPDFVRDLFDFVVEMELRFARAQVEAGADLIGVGDAASSLIGPQLYESFVFPHAKRLVDGLHVMGVPVRLHICGNTRKILQAMGQLGCELVDLDYPAALSDARAQMGPDQVLLGNIEPVGVLRNQSAEQVTQAIAACHRQAGSHYIVGAGCEVCRDTPPENVRALGEYARSHKP
jgi:MtaA/CmuA family methyltransferase